MRPDAVIALAVTIVVLAGICVGYLRYARRQRAANRLAGTLARFDDLGLTRTRLLDGYGPHPASYTLRGLRASVDSVGQLTSRVTLTRVALTGVFALALRKKVDDRSVFLTIEGPGVAIVREIPVRTDPGVQRSARAFAAAINAQARAFESSPQDATPPVGC